MKKVAKHKILKILVICMLLVFITNPALAAINEEYYIKDPSTSEGLSQAVSGSTLLELLAKLVYAVGRLLEWLLGKIFSLLTGYSDFPWADKIVFNAVPLLDVNFMNPHTYSFAYAIQDVIKSTYATVMALAVSFFGIFVLITALKLVLSTIASEKAKYKQAIIDWILGLVLLFCMHYGISFIFYLNEELVTVASKIVTNNLAMNKKVMEVQNSKMVDNLIAGIQASGYGDVADFLREHRTLANTWLNELDTSDDSDGIHEALMKDMDEGTDEAIEVERQYDYLMGIFNWALNSPITIDELKDIYENEIHFFAAGISMEDNLLGDFGEWLYYSWLGDFLRWYTNLVDTGANLLPTGTVWGFQFITNETYEKIFYSGHGAYFPLDGYFATGCMKNIDEIPEDYLCDPEEHIGVGDCDDREYYKIEAMNGRLYAFGFTGISTQCADLNFVDAFDRATLRDADTAFNNMVEASDMFKDGTKKKWKNFFYDNWVSTGIEHFEKFNPAVTMPSKLSYDNVVPTGYAWSRVIEDLILLKEAAIADKTGEDRVNNNAKSRILSDLASYFRFNAYTRTLGVDGSVVGTNDKGNIQIQNMLMYTILVVQSLILFIAYIKRLFYVVIMALIAPVVVVMDFFSKFGK